MSSGMIQTGFVTDLNRISYALREGNLELQREYLEKIGSNFILQERRLIFSAENLYKDFLKDAPYPTWRTRMQPIRTAAEIHAHIKILPVQQPHLYQKITQKAIELRLLGMSYPQIAKALNINKKTARKACKFKEG
jgi:hypothetical protein